MSRRKLDNPEAFQKTLDCVTRLRKKDIKDREDKLTPDEASKAYTEIDKDHKQAESNGELSDNMVRMLRRLATHECDDPPQ